MSGFGDPGKIAEGILENYLGVPHHDVHMQDVVSPANVVCYLPTSWLYLMNANLVLMNFQAYRVLDWLSMSDVSLRHIQRTQSYDVSRFCSLAVSAVTVLYAMTDGQQPKLTWPRNVAIAKLVRSLTLVSLIHLLYRLRDMRFRRMHKGIRQSLPSSFEDLVLRRSNPHCRRLPQSYVT